MENFEELLEQYLDEEEIEKKKNLEEDIVEDKKLNSRKDLRYLEEYTITITEFLRDYIKMDVNNIKTNNLTHKNLKDLTKDNPLVIGIFNDYVDVDEIMKRDYLIVTDCFGNIGSYLNPNYLRDMTKLELMEKELKIIEKSKIVMLEELEEYYTKFMSVVREHDYLEKKCSRYYELLENVEKEDTIRKIRRYIKHFDDSLLDAEEHIVKPNGLSKSIIEERNMKF